MEKRRQKELFTTWELLNYKKSLQQCPLCIMITSNSLFCKMFSPLFCFERGKTWRNFSKKLYTSNKVKKKGKAEMKNSIWDMPEVAQIFERHSQTVQSRYVYRSLFVFDHCIKQIDSILPWVCSVIDHRGRLPKCGKNVSDTLAFGSRATSLFLPHFDVIYDLLLGSSRTTTATATRTSLEKWIRPSSNFFSLIPSRLIRQMLTNVFGVGF